MPTVVRFDCYEVDLAAGQLLKRGSKVRLREQCVQVLAALLERPGQVVTREDLRRRLWPDDVFVDFDNNLNSVVARLRDVLNDSAEHPRFIETLPRHGYRFIGTVSGPAPVAASAGTRLLVLPFVNASGDPAQEHFSDAVTDGLITELAALAPAHLAVIARTTAMRYKGSGKDVAQIGRELNVEYIVEGAVSRVDDRLQVNAQLIRKSDQAHMFARRYDAPIHDLLETERAVARAVAEQLHVLPLAAVEHESAVGPVASDDNQDRRPLSRGSPEDFASAALPTPTHEAVASDETFGISVRGAVLFLIAAVVLLVPVLALSGRVTDLGKTRPELSSAALAARAREIAVKAGWPARPKDATYGFLRDEAHLDYLDAHRFDWKQLGALRPAHIQFWYQQAPRWIVPSGIKSGVPANKWPTGPGVTSLLLDARGDLLQFHTTPPEPGVAPAAHPADWAALFDAAGLDIARFKGARAGPGAVSASDGGQSWLGASADAPNIPIRVEGAGLGGRVVSFVVVRPWSSPASMSAPATVAPSGLGPNLPGIQILGWTGLIAACLLAWRNRTLGHADVRGAFRLAAVIFCFKLCEWLLLEHLTPTGDSVQRLTMAVGSSCFAGGSIFVVYMALEPYARRYWPASLISWTRLIAGRGRDPLLGRDVLVGVVVGLGMSVAYWLHAIHAGWLGYRPAVYTDALNALELGTVLARIAYCASYGVWTAAGGLLILTLARLVLRKEWMAAAILTLISALAWAPRLGTGPFPLQVAYMIAVFGPWVWALRRYGMVAAAVATFVSSVRKMAITSDPSLWYAPHTLIVGALLLALIAYGFHTALGSRRLWRDDLAGG